MSEVNWKPQVRELQERGLFEVESEKHPNRTYVVDLISRTCTCPHFRYRGVQCKHIKAAVPQQVEVLTVETIPRILGEISRKIHESAEENFHYEEVY
jgi:uncharacterized Zn finger protein